MITTVSEIAAPTLNALLFGNPYLKMKQLSLSSWLYSLSSRKLIISRHTDRYIILPILLYYFSTGKNTIVYETASLCFRIFGLWPSSAIELNSANLKSSIPEDGQGEGLRLE